MKKSIIIIAAWLFAAQWLLAQSFNPGAEYGGGVIIYIEPGKTWGLVAAKADVPKVGGGGFTYAQAVAACKDWVHEKKGDWYLPSEPELVYMIPYRSQLNLYTQLCWSTTASFAAGSNLVKNFAGTPSTLIVPVGNSTTFFGDLTARAVRRFYFPLTSTGVEAACLPVTSGSDFVPGPANIIYGSGIDIKNNSRRMNVTVGELVVGQAREGDNNAAFGSLAGFLLAPFGPIVTASQGELLDRIQISWEPNPLGPLPTEGYKLYRDGVFLGAFDNKVRNFNDFNVIAGRPYKYEVLGVNVYGDGALGSALGFQVPNGVVTGYVQTSNNSPVVDAMVTLMPMQGFSALFGASDLAFAQDTAGFLKNATNWTLTTWVQTDAALAGSKILEFEGASWSLTPIESATMHEGVVLNVTGQPSPLTIQFPDSTKNGWHHIAITHDGAQFRAYLDGVLVGIITAAAANGDTKMLNIAGEGSNWEGRLDELRIYHRKLDELDFGEVIEGTASSLTPGLKYYWKMDEELGTKSFDVIGRNRLFFCGPVFDKSRPPVRTSGKTNSDGYYRIESANYGTGTTFIATPSKNFYMHRALKFVSSEQDYATLPDFGLTDSTNLQTATLELWANSAGPDGPQCLLSKKWGSQEFRLSLVPNGNNNDLKCTLGGALGTTTHTFGTFGMGYQHLALTFEQTGGNVTVKAYKNGAALGSTANFSGQSGNWSDPSQEWLVGACLNGATRTDYFGGLLDEVAMYDTILPIADIQAHATAARDPQARHLRAYFAFDEGAGNQLNNAGAKLTGAGKSYGTEWAAFSAIQKTEPHVFAPKTRQVTLNPSVTSVDIVDFVDLSTVPVTGYVRFANTDCFAENVEILVNGTSFNPNIFTDSTGRFVVDLEPGATVRLSPKFEDHAFAPAFWDVTNISSPIAGVLFNDMTTRTVKGVVAGGTCKKSIIPAGTVCKVKIRSEDGCYEKTQQILDPGGEYEFTDLPPKEMIVAIIEHSDPTVKTAFQVQGGVTVDLGKQDTTINFIYFAPPVIEIASGFDPTPPCAQVVFDQGETVTINIRLAEDYYGDLCYVDSAALRILNGLAGEAVDTAMGGGVLKYKFKVGNPNPAAPFLQTLQIIATTLKGDEVSLVKQAIVTGLRSKEQTFTTILPETPWLVLRDPPGDGSYAYWEKGQKTCQTVTTSIMDVTGGGGTLELHLGADVTQVVAPFGVGILIENDALLNQTFEVTHTNEYVSDSSFQTCISFDQRISTSEDELVVGAQGGDVYVGGGMNIVFGFADLVNFNPATCVASVTTVLNVEPDGFKTMFMYSEFNIRRNVMRYLDSLAADPAASAADKAKYLDSKTRWEDILKNNDKQKKAAKFERNLSFDAGVTYEYSITSDTTTTSSSGSNSNTEINYSTDFGFDILGIGVEVNVDVTAATSTGETTENGTEKGLKTGYVLADNDPGDAFSVDIAMDDVYKTPVFNTKIGQSSCPWEPSTAHREGCLMSLAPGSGAVAVDVPANEPAVYKFILANTGATNELRTYAFTTGPESNPHGAVIKLNGAVLDHPVLYAIPPGEPIMVTITLERGPEEYDYDDLEIVLYSECEDTRANRLGLVPDEDTILYSAINVSAHFIKPCSEVEVTGPDQDWVLHPDPDTPGPDDDLRITLSGYDRNDPDLEVMRVQYRPSVGDGAWINIGSDIPKAALGPIFYQHTWPTSGLPDGPYEIRAVAVCSGNAADKPGYSHVIKGRIERTPPQIIGVPEPSDGVLNVGDEISVTFNKSLNCSKIFKADLTNARNVGLYDTETNKLIDFDLYCFENKIELVPNFQNKFFENKVLRLQLNNIPDLIGNKLVSADWEFFVDRNELAWLTDSVGMTKTERETKTVTAGIHNRGGAPTPFTITGAPSWVRIVPDKGTLVPNEIRPISFEVDSSLAFGTWSDSITLRTETGANPFFMGGDEKLPIGVRVVCDPPNWNLNAGIHPVTMNMVVALNIQGTPSIDEEDIVAAFINDELRGRARVQYFPSVDKYLAHLTIFGESAEVTDPINFQIWDASACLRYGTVAEAFTFQPDNVIGTPVNPQVLHTNNLVLREIPLNNGWNWVSFNLAFPDPAINPALATLKHPENDLIKDQNDFATYSGGWFGSLTTLGNTSMYQFRADQPDTLKMTGNVIDPTAVNIPLNTGWNWVGYLPNYPLSVDDALASINAVTGDLIKGQYGFSQFINGFGWIGNLKFMYPPLGYQVKLTNPGILTYPPKPVNKAGHSSFLPDIATGKGGAAPSVVGPSHWVVNPTQFEHSMTLVGMLASGGQNMTLLEHEIGVFAGNEVRGSAKAIFIEPLDAYLFFLTTYSNASGEQLKFKLYDAATGQTVALAETMFFASDLHQGSVLSPVPFTQTTSGTHEAVLTQLLDVQPNPFNNGTSVSFGAARDQDVQFTVTDMQGREMQRFRMAARQGLNTWNWQPDLATGVYYIRLQTAEGTAVRKVVKE